MEPDENQRLLAAAAHGLGFVGFGGIGPAVIWLLHKDKPEARFVAFHAAQAAVFQIALIGFVIVTAFCTFGLSTILLLPAMALDLWLAYQAYQGEWASYPGFGDLGRGDG